MEVNKVDFTISLGQLAEVPGTPFAYWAPSSLRHMFRVYPPLDRDIAKRTEKSKIADVKNGTSTADDFQFTRFWWEIPIDGIAISNRESGDVKKWVPFARSGKPYFNDVAVVVNWGKDGEPLRKFGKSVIRNPSFYFRSGLAFSNIVRNPSMDAYKLPEGCIFSNSSFTVFSTNSSWPLLAFLNSRFAWAIFHLLNPTAHNKDVGYISLIPISPEINIGSIHSQLAHEGHDIIKEWSTGDETCTIFIQPRLLCVWAMVQGLWDEKNFKPITNHPLAREFEWSNWESAYQIRQWIPLATEMRPFNLRWLSEICVERERLLRQKLEDLQCQIDEEIYRLYEISPEERALIDAELHQASQETGLREEENDGGETEDDDIEEGLLTVEEHLRRLVHYLVHEIIKVDSDGIVPIYDTYMPDGRLESGLNTLINQRLVEIFGVANLETCLSDLHNAFKMSLEEWLETEFFPYHTSFYRLRPILWQITSHRRGKPAFSCLIYWHKFDSDTLRKIQQVYLRPLADTAKQEAERLGGQIIALRESGAPLRTLREADRSSRQVEDRWDELRSLQEHIQALLQPHALSVQSRSDWVIEKVNEIVVHGYQPVRDYGVRVNIEPLKQAGILPQAAERVKG